MQECSEFIRLCQDGHGDDGRLGALGAGGVYTRHVEDFEQGHAAEGNDGTSDALHGFEARNDLCPRKRRLEEGPSAGGDGTCDSAHCAQKL